MDGGGATSTTTRSVTVSNPNNPPIGCFSMTRTSLTINVDASCSSDPDGDSLTYAWDWGDGSPKGNGLTAAHEYAYVGYETSYLVTLTARDGRGGSDVESQWVAVVLTTYLDIDVDSEYVNVYGGATWSDYARYILSLANQRYRSQAGLEFNWVIIRYNSQLTSTNIDTAWATFKTSKPSPFAPPTVFASYFSGKDFGGSTIGYGEQQGFYSLIQQVGDIEHAFRPVNDFEKAYAVKHEFGHNHNGDHPYADFWFDSNCNCVKRTIMQESFWWTFVDQFSEGTMDPAHNNGKRMREFIDFWRR